MQADGAEEKGVRTKDERNDDAGAIKKDDGRIKQQRRGFLCKVLIGF